MNEVGFHRTATPIPPLRVHSPEFRALCAAISEGALTRDKDRIAPFDMLDLIRRARLGALRLPVAAGGAGITLRELFETVIHLGEADSNVAHILRNHFVLADRYARRQDSAKAHSWRTHVAAGALFGLASTELTSLKAGRGGALQTSIVPDGEGYVLNGTKYYSTGNLYADYIVVRAQTPDGRTASVVIPSTREGVDRADDWDGMGQRLTGSGTTTFTGVAVAADEVIFDAEDGDRYSATFPQLYLTAVNAGILRAILRDAKGLLRSRGRSFYHAPAERPTEDPLLLQTIGQIASSAFAAEAIVLAAAAALDAVSLARDASEPSDNLALEASLAAAKAKIVVDDLTIRAGSLVFDVGGASASKKSNNLDAHWRNARTLASHNPSSYKALAIGGYEVNGIPLPNGSFF